MRKGCGLSRGAGQQKRVLGGTGNWGRANPDALDKGKNRSKYRKGGGEVGRGGLS